MSKYEVKGVKTFKGMEGAGFSANLYRDGKKVAEVVDSAHGGDFDYQFLDRKEPKVEVKVINLSNKTYSYQGTPEEAKLAEYVSGMTFVSEFDGKSYSKGVDGFMDELINNYENDKRFKRLCKTSIVVKLKSSKEDEFFTFKGKYCPNAKIQIEGWAKKKGEEIIEIVNERYTA